MFVQGCYAGVEKQPGVNKRKQSAYTWDRPPQQMTSNCSPDFPPFNSLYWFYSKAMLNTNFWGEENGREQQLRVHEINVRHSASEQSLSLGELGGGAGGGFLVLFLFASGDFISPFSHWSEKSNKDDWLHFITVGFIFQGDLQVQPDNVGRKKRKKRNYVPSVLTEPMACNSVIIAAAAARIKLLICIAPW